MKKLLTKFLLVAVLAIAALPAWSQTVTTKVVTSCGGETLPLTSPAWIRQDATGALCITGSLTASLAGFTPNGNFGTLTATAASSASTSLPAGAVVAFQNTSTVDLSCVLDPTSAVATTNKLVIRGGATVFLTVGSNTKAACIDQTGSASNVVVMAGGTGLGTNFGGGGSGGGGGAVTQSGTWTVQPGNTANTTAWLVTGAGGTFPVTGTFWQATQPVSGTFWQATQPVSGAFSTAAAQGTTADAPCTLPATTTACSEIAIQKAMANVGLSAVPTVQSGGPSAPAALISCDNHVFKHITTATDTLAVQGVTSKVIYICGWRSRAAGTATWYLENTASTNANCSSTLTQITGLASEVANSGDVTYNPIWGGLKNTSGNGLCINSTGTGGVDVDIWYAQF